MSSSFLPGLFVIVLLIALVYAWYRCHRQLRAKGYGPTFVTTAFVVLLFTCLAIGGSLADERISATAPFALWIAVAVLLTRGLPYRKGAVKDGQVVQTGTRTAGKRRAWQASDRRIRAVSAILR